jgi:ABC-2 type transport system ATP-binding protein
METVIAEQLFKQFNSGFRLGPLDLRVAPGEILGVMGPGGSGKTTLLRLLWGFMRPDDGNISIFGMPPHLEQVKVRLKAGYLPENRSIYSSFTPRQFLRFVGNFYPSWDEYRAETLLKQLEVDPDLPIETLAQGDLIKVNLISAVGHRPSLLILDEPTLCLDTLWLLKFLARREKVSILLSSDISDDLDHIADSILMLNHGRTVHYARNPRDL